MLSEWSELASVQFCGILGTIVLVLGYLGEYVKGYFLSFYTLVNDIRNHKD